MKNVTNDIQTIEFLPPSIYYSWLKFSPTVLKLQPGERQRVEIDFNPPKGLQENKPEEWYQGIVEDTAGNDQIQNPFRKFEVDPSGRWTVGSGLYGTLQWANTLWNKPKEAKNTIPVEESEKEPRRER